jgi:hypothetical protein
MWRPLSRSIEATLLGLALFFGSTQACAQACCAGTGALTPGRLALHEDALVGVGARAADGIGSWDDSGNYTRTPAGTRELDFEQDVFGAVRILGRGQLALLVPFVETERKAGGRSELGGGVGDVNLAARWDFTLAGRSRYVPGIAALAGVTAPTGRPPDSAQKPLATDATGIGAWQLTGGLALEQIYGNWLFDLTGLVQKRTSRSAQGVSTTLGTRFTALAGAAYVFEGGVALAAFASYAVEGRAEVDGQTVDGTAQRATQFGLSGVAPFAEQRWRVQASVFLDPPLNSFGENQPALVGASVTLVRAFW